LAVAVGGQAAGERKEEGRGDRRKGTRKKEEKEGGRRKEAREQ
jgi:hypothetical protein